MDFKYKGDPEDCFPMEVAFLLEGNCYADLSIDQVTSEQEIIHVVSYDVTTDDFTII